MKEWVLMLARVPGAATRAKRIGEFERGKWESLKAGELERGNWESWVLLRDQTRLWLEAQRFFKGLVTYEFHLMRKLTSGTF